MYFEGINAKWICWAIAIAAMLSMCAERCYVFAQRRMETDT
jgi:hypothetical protein